MLIGGCLRTSVLHNVVWSVNSIGHRFGNEDFRRARKDYCIRLFESAMASKDSAVRILNVASGPGRDVFEFLRGSSNERISGVSIHYIDQDANAIKHAKNLLEPYCNQVTFENRNVFRARLTNNYDLVWSAGLFDYLEDNIFIRLLSKLSSALSPGGRACCGQFF